VKEGDPIIVNTPEGKFKATAGAINPGETPEAEPTVTASTPLGDVEVPLRDVNGLPKDYETAREAHGAPLEQMPQAIADTTLWRRPAPTHDLFAAIRGMGGIRTVGADGKANDAGEKLKDAKKQPGLVNNKAGQDPDKVREALQQDGWFGANGGDTTDDLFELIGKQARGQRVFHPDTQDAEALAQREDIDQQMQAAGVSHADSKQVAAAKLARWRGEQVRRNSPQAEAYRKRLAELGIELSPDATLDDLRDAVAEREAILSADASHPMPEGYEDLLQNDAERSVPADLLYDHAILNADEHEWLASADRGPRGVEGEAPGDAGVGAETGPGSGDAEEAEHPGEHSEVGGEDAREPHQAQLTSQPQSRPTAS